MANLTGLKLRKIRQKWEIYKVIQEIPTFYLLFFNQY